MTDAIIETEEVCRRCKSKIVIKAHPWGLYTADCKCKAWHDSITESYYHCQKTQDKALKAHRKWEKNIIDQYGDEEPPDIAEEIRRLIHPAEREIKEIVIDDKYYIKYYADDEERLKSILCNGINVGYQLRALSQFCVMLGVNE